jgi:hypothetical protein
VYHGPKGEYAESKRQAMLLASGQPLTAAQLAFKSKPAPRGGAGAGGIGGSGAAAQAASAAGTWAAGTAGGMGADGLGGSAHGTPAAASLAHSATKALQRAHARAAAREAAGFPSREFGLGGIEGAGYRHLEAAAAAAEDTDADIGADDTVDDAGKRRRPALGFSSAAAPRSASRTPTPSESACPLHLALPSLYGQVARLRASPVCKGVVG